MKRLFAAAAITAALSVGLAAPAGAIIIIGGTSLGGPDTRTTPGATATAGAAVQVGVACPGDAVGFNPQPDPPGIIRVLVQAQVACSVNRTGPAGS